METSKQNTAYKAIYQGDNMRSDSETVETDTKGPEAETVETKPKNWIIRQRTRQERTEDEATGAITMVTHFKYLTALGVEGTKGEDGQLLDKGKGPKWGLKDHALRFAYSDAKALATRYHPAEAVPLVQREVSDE
jgi:hypothetical protein